MSTDTPQNEQQQYINMIQFLIALNSYSLYSHKNRVKNSQQPDFHDFLESLTPQFEWCNKPSWPYRRCYRIPIIPFMSFLNNSDAKNATRCQISSGYLITISCAKKADLAQYIVCDQSLRRAIYYILYTVILLRGIYKSIRQAFLYRPIITDTTTSHLPSNWEAI